jgi:pimeloyl-ACP methyl ester carboxylesterase
MNRAGNRWGRLRLAIIGLVLAGGAAEGRAQGRAALPPPPVEHTLTTKDGVQIRITYYASNAGAQATPVILLHDRNETRAVFNSLAKLLQSPRAPDDAPELKVNRSRAVVAVDLRGHGESKTAFDSQGAPVELDASRFGQVDFQNMVLFDMEAVRSFLVEQNDAGLLNLNKLCIVGSGMGANVAVLWAAKDWATPNLAVRKQGQDVKALVLLSPRWNYNGLSLKEPMKFRPIQQSLSILLAYGEEDPGVARDCKNIDKILARFHPEPPADQVQTRKDYYLIAEKTNLQGTELLTSREFGLTPIVAGFIEARLGRREFPHVTRKN